MRKTRALGKSVICGIALLGTAPGQCPSLGDLSPLTTQVDINQEGVLYCDLLPPSSDDPNPPNTYLLVTPNKSLSREAQIRKSPWPGGRIPVYFDSSFSYRGLLNRNATSPYLYQVPDEIELIERMLDTQPKSPELWSRLLSNTTLMGRLRRGTRFELLRAQFDFERTFTFEEGATLSAEYVETRRSMALQSDVLNSALTAMEHWNAFALGTIHFEEVEEIPQDIDVKVLTARFYPTGCSANVGFETPRWLNLSPQCAVRGTLHELGHVLGLRHEHQRLDREEWIVLHPENISEEKLGNYCIQRERELLSEMQYTPYDFFSLMHYREFGDDLSFTARLPEYETLLEGMNNGGPLPVKSPALLDTGQSVLGSSLAGIDHYITSCDVYAVIAIYGSTDLKNRWKSICEQEVNSLQLGASTP